ncbi:cupin domain-containing protein [Algoriphagus sp.]|uniref:cupin domain-containing protein n=1 Tax=Algoriphagus sp. TaxID=1872435 RepID=UPI0039196C3C
MENKIELKATGETITFITTSKDSKGEFVEVITILPADGEGPPLHRHVLQTELFEAIEGRLGLDCGDKKIILEPGQSFTVPANTPHRCYSVDGDVIKFKGVFTPPLSIEYFLTEMFEACNRTGTKDPTTFDGCYILRQVKDEYLLEDPAIFVQQTLFPFIAIIGKTFGQIKAKSKSAFIV